MTRRVAVVAGDASGLGLGIARRLARDGHAVAVLDFASTDEAASAIREADGLSIGIEVDLTDRAALDRASAQVRAELGVPSILVNCAERSAWGDFLEISEEEWRSAVSANLTSAFLCCQVFMPGMVDIGWGRVINMSSMVIHSGVPRLAPYVAAKSGVVGLTKSLSLEFAPHGITVNTVPSGLIDTPAIRRSEERGFIDFASLVKGTPVGRPGLPEDIGAVCSFLASDEAGYLTGQIIPMNGGRASTDP